MELSEAFVVSVRRYRSVVRPNRNVVRPYRSVIRPYRSSLSFFRTGLMPMELSEVSVLIVASFVLSVRPYRYSERA